ncbi:MAG: hypothetical protein JRI87_08330 [Deltaproteobacteria bacterium]|nr:hypothetical protein [Deltaproteobacteria bacterium]
MAFHELVTGYPVENLIGPVFIQGPIIIIVSPEALINCSIVIVVYS